jgi:Transposase DDE domain
VIACGRGTPLAVSLTGGNRNDITQLVPLLDAIPPVRGRRGRPRRRPRRLLGDRAYHARQARRELRKRGIKAKIAWPKSAHGSGLGRERWSSGRSPGYTSTGACASATSAAPTSTWRSCTSPEA